MASGECSGRILGKTREDKTMIGLGRFVLQSYEKSEFEVERSCTGYTARCMSRRMTKKAHQRQPSRRRTPVHRKKAQVSLCFFPIRKHYHSLLALHLALSSHNKQEIETRTQSSPPFIRSHVPLIPSFPSHSRKHHSHNGNSSFRSRSRRS